MKIKTFLIEATEVVEYSEEKVKKTNGDLSYNLKPELLDNTINDFIKDKKIISISQNSFIKGNNPPTPILIYTIIYE